MKEKAEILKAKFEGELMVLRSRYNHFKCGNSDIADKYEREIRQIEKLISVLEILIG